MGNVLLFLIAVIVKSIPSLLILGTGFLLNKSDKKRDYMPSFWAAAVLIAHLNLR